MTFLRFTAPLLVIAFVATPVFAEEAAPSPAPAKARVQRRVERHNRDRSQAVKAHGRVLEIDTVVVPGRPGRPQAAIEPSVQQFKFPVGTARYSEADQRFVKQTSARDW